MTEQNTEQRRMSAVIYSAINSAQVLLFLPDINVKQKQQQRQQQKSRSYLTWLTEAVGNIDCSFKPGKTQSK